MTYQQYNVLRLIDTTGPQAQAEVARYLVVTAPVVTRLASALVEDGLVERQADPDDKRAVILALTDTGRRRARAMRRDLLAAARELLEPLPDRSARGRRRGARGAPGAAPRPLSAPLRRRRASGGRRGRAGAVEVRHPQRAAPAALGAARARRRRR